VNLEKSFYEQDTKKVAHALLGCVLISEIGGKNQKTAGIIVETEAYLGEKDPGSHAYKGKTRRTQIMYGEPGRAYIYLIYGIHCLLNVVTEPVGTPGAVLIRALEPFLGLEHMKKRRHTQNERNVTSGPGKLTQALGITIDHCGLDLTGDTVWIEQHTHPDIIAVSPRIGVSDTQCLRFSVAENVHVSHHV
jgi:DNA-3-methyladenine glycosylase